jgi:hypothetical protein
VTTSKTSPVSVDDTVARITKLLESKGVKLFAVIDHSGEARAAGLELRETRVVISGNPAAGTPSRACDTPAARRDAQSGSTLQSNMPRLTPG